MRADGRDVGVKSLTKNWSKAFEIPKQWKLCWATQDLGFVMAVLVAMEMRTKD